MAADSEQQRRAAGPPSEPALARPGPSARRALLLKRGGGGGRSWVDRPVLRTQRHTRYDTMPTLLHDATPAPPEADRAPPGVAWPATELRHVRPVRGAPPPEETWRRFGRDLVRGALVLALLHLFVVQISVVRGHSMEPSLHDGDRLVVDRLTPQIGGVQRFDVVVLRYPCDPQVDFVKRVVGLPGDRVRMDGDGLLVNGQRVAQSFGHVADRSGMAERIVPEGHYFVLGDNRPISCDSREFGFVPSDYVKGKVRACFWPFGRVGLL